MTTENLSHIGKAAIETLEKNHGSFKEKLWELTSGRMVDDLQHAPRDVWHSNHDPEDTHSDWFPKTLGEIISTTEHWCDVMSLSPPDGLFLEEIKIALLTVANRSKETGNKVVVRFMFGNIIAVPCDCTNIINDLTENLPADSNLRIYVGAWRKGMCWNHAKIIAVDGKVLHTGGHNLWDKVYLKKDPIHDTSIQLQGNVALAAHRFANEQWEFIQGEQSTLKGQVVNMLPDKWRLPLITRVTISEYPKGVAETFAPSFKEELIPTENVEEMTVDPIITLGRYGNIIPNARSSDEAFIAMFDAAQTIIRFFLQDLGPVNKTVLGKKISYKGWPNSYMSAMGRAIWLRDVDIQIVLSNPTSGEDRGNYSNGWSCAEVAAEIIKTIKKQFPDADDVACRKKVEENLDVCFIKVYSGSSWKTSNKVGLHSKVFIVDDVCTYVGSQNLYLFDLAEWGVCVDSKDTTANILKYLWNPMWSCSFDEGRDCQVDEVMDALKFDRNPKEEAQQLSDAEIAAMESNINIEDMKKSKFFFDGDGDEQCRSCVIS